MLSEPIITPQSAAATQDIDLSNYENVTITGSNIAGAEYVDIFLVDSYGTPITALSWDARAHAIDSTNGAVAVSGGYYRITKSATASASAAVCFSPIKSY